MTRPAIEPSALSATAPEPGQLVEVRRRQWIVADVDASAVSPDLPKRNLVKLASIDEHALGDVLTATGVIGGITAISDLIGVDGIARQ